MRFLFTFVIAFLFAATSTQAQQYTITELPGRAYGINDNGQVVGAGGYLYSNGGIQYISGIGDGRRINNSGQILGSSGRLYSNGAIQEVGGDAYGLNDNGDVCGYYIRNDGSAQAFLYSNGVRHDLGSFGGMSVALAINDNGVVTGAAYASPSDGPHLVLWSADVVQDLGFHGEAHAINNNNQITGIGLGQNTVDAFVWSNGVMTVFNPLNQPAAGYGESINDSGIVVGWTQILVTGIEYRPFIYSSGAWQDLNQLIDANSGWVLSQAESINNSGQIVGWGTNSLGQERGFILTPIPSPASLFTIGLAVLVCRRHR